MIKQSNRQCNLHYQLYISWYLPRVVVKKNSDTMRGGLGQSYIINGPRSGAFSRMGVSLLWPTITP